MHFALTEEQVALRDGVRELLADRCTPSADPASLWSDLTGLGVVGAAVPEKLGGLGLSGVDLALILEEIGYAAVPLPIAETAAVAAPLLAEAGDPRLDGLLDGTARVALAQDDGLLAGSARVALAQGDGLLDGGDRVVFAQGEGLVDGGARVVLAQGEGLVDGGARVALAQDDGLLDGGARIAPARGEGLVPFGDRAEFVLVLRVGEARLVRPVNVRRMSTVDPARAVVRCDLPGGGQVTGDPRLIGRARRRAALATAAQLVGLGRRMLDLTVDYVRERRQFGVPVGSFQAVKHHLAEALLRLEFAAPAVLAAAWAIDVDASTAERDVSVAAVLAGEAAQQTAKAAIQCHGAMGYTVEYPLHLYAKRTWALVAGADLGGQLDRLTKEVFNE